MGSCADSDACGGKRIAQILDFALRHADADVVKEFYEGQARAQAAHEVGRCGSADLAVWDTHVMWAHACVHARAPDRLSVDGAAPPVYAHGDKHADRRRVQLPTFRRRALRIGAAVFLTSAVLGCCSLPAAAVAFLLAGLGCI